MMNVLIILTSHNKLGETGLKTGFWLEEFAAPYFTLLDAGANITLASPKGGQPPIDPKSDEPDFQTAATERFKSDSDAQAVLANTSKLSDIKPEDYDAVMYPGWHGLLCDLANYQDSIAIIEAMVAANKPVASVCHAPAVILKAKAPNGEPLVKGKKVAGFTNSEEDAVQLTQVVPLLVEDELIRLGGEYSKVDDWQSYAITDGKLITGQNPASSEAVAKDILELFS